mgnify:CR=1 FL=1
MKIVKYEYDSFLKLHEKLGINKTKKYMKFRIIRDHMNGMKNIFLI